MTNSTTICTHCTPPCNKQAVARTMCNAAYQRWRRAQPGYQEPKAVRKTAAAVKRTYESGRQSHASLRSADPALYARRERWIETIAAQHNGDRVAAIWAVIEAAAAANQEKSK